MSDLTNRSLESFVTPPPKNKPLSSRIDDIFLFNPANRQFVEGERGITNPRKSGCIWLFFVPFVLMGIGFLVWAGMNLSQWETLSQSGITATAEITGKHSSDSGEYTITYRFKDEHNTYAHEQRVVSDLYDRAIIGTHVKIVYVAEHPNIAELASTNNPPWFPIGFAIGWNVLVWGIFISLVGRIWMASLLERQGHIVTGEVAMCSGTFDSDGDYSLILDYTFRSPYSGQIIKGTARQMRNDLKSNALPMPGALLAVLYRKDQHHQPL